MQSLHLYTVRAWRMKNVSSIRHFLPAIAFLIFLLTGTGAYAQLAIWNPSGLSGYGPSPWAPTSVNTNVTVTGLTRGSGVSTGGTAAGNAWGGSDWNGGSNVDATFTITAKAGFQLSLSALNMYYRRSGTGPGTGSLQYAIGSGTYTTITTWSFSNTSSSGSSLPSVSLTGYADLQNVAAGTIVKFRILPTGGASTGTWYVFSSGLNVTGSVTAAPANCAVPAGLTTNNVTASTADLSWSSSAGSTGYEYVIDQTVAVPTGAGTAISATSYSASTLTPATNYYLHVRSNCGSGNFSTWATLPFTTAAGCTSVTAGTISGSAANPACGSANSILTLAGATATNTTYQWQTSADSISWSNTGTNNDTLNTGTIAASTYYRAIVNCISGSMSDTTLAYKLVVTPLPNPAVTIAANPGNTICAGTPVTFTATANDGGTAPSYEWKKGATVVGTNNTYTDNALANGEVITVSMTSNAACASTTPAVSNGITMTVNPTLIPTVTTIVNPGDTICAGTMVTFTPVPNNGGTAPLYEWKKNGMVVGAAGISYTDNTLANGDVITVTMISNAACASTIPAVHNDTIVVNPVLTPSVTVASNPGNTICSGTSVTFTAVPVNGGTPTYEWKKGTTVVGTGASYTSSTLASGDVITVSMTSNATCASIVPVTSPVTVLTVNPVLTPSVTITSSAGTTGCLGGPVTFTAAPVNGGSTPVYQWYKNSSIVGGNSVTYTDATLATGDVIRATMISNANCASTVPVSSQDILMTMNTPVTPEVSVTITPGDTICAGTMATYTATPVNGGAAPTYVWRKNGQLVFAGTNPVYSNNMPVNNDTVLCIMTSNAGCVTKSADSAMVVVKVRQAVIPTVTITASPGTQVPLGTSVTFTASVTNEGLAPNYQWKVNGVNAGTNSNTYTSGSWAANDTITCEVTSSNICATPAVAISNSLIMKTPTGIGQVKNTGNDITLFPNPNSGAFTLAGSIVNGQEVTVEIVNIVGRMVYQSTIPVSNTRISHQVDLPQNIAGGTYLLRVRSASGMDVMRFTVAR